MKRLTDWLVYLMVRVFICVIQAIRLETCHSVARLLAIVACDIAKVRHTVVDDNIRHAYPDMTEHERRNTARRMWEHLLLMVCEIAHAPRKIHETNWHQHISIRRKRDIVKCLVDVRPAVLIAGHFGNFELTSFMMGLWGFPGYTIARDLDNPYLDRYLKRFRSANGQFILPKEGSASQVDAVLRSGGTIALLGDQSAGPKGCWIDFMGRPASCHKAVALFTLVSGAPLVVCYGKRTHGSLQFEIGAQGVADPRIGGDELASVKTLTQWYSNRLEEVIRMAPEQYWWVHRRWKGAPRKKRKPERKAA